MPVTNYDTVNGRTFGENQGGNQKCYMLDALGNVTGYTDQHGTVISRYWYKPYGDLLTAPTASDPTLMFCGAWGYRKTGRPVVTHDVKHRLYDSAAGRWTSADPLFPAQPAFVYAKSRPTFYIDPQGLWAAIVSLPVANLTYQHAYLQFEHPCGESPYGAQKSFGFGSWHSRDDEALRRIIGDSPFPGGVVVSPPLEGTPRGVAAPPTGALLFPDPASRNLPIGVRMDADVARNLDLVNYEPEFERVLCECVKSAMRRYAFHGAPSYRFYRMAETDSGFYGCGTWAHEMWDCAHDIVHGGDSSPQRNPIPGSMAGRFQAFQQSVDEEIRTCGAANDPLSQWWRTGAACAK